MADVTTTFAAKDESFASTVSALQERLASFGGAVSGFNDRVSAITHGFKDLIGPLVGIGAALLGVKEVMDSFKNAIDMGGRLENLSKRTNVAAGDLVILERAFKLNGAAADAVGPAMDRLNMSIAEAGNGAKAQTETLQRLGITYQQLAALTPLEQMRLLAERIGAIGDPALRTAVAVDVFGKAGSQLIPILRNFDDATEKAKAQLGSLPDILNKTSANLDNMSGVLDGMSTKFDEFTVGVIAGVSAAKDFGQALANIDAAGFGQGIGQSLRLAFEQPLLTAKIIGQTLLVGAKEASNNLINAALTAGLVWVKTVSAADYAEAIGLRIRSGLLEALNAFNKVLASSIKTFLLEPFAAIPGIVGDPFRTALASVQNIQATLDATSSANYALWTKGGELISGSFQDAANNTQVITKDWLGVAASADQAAQYIQQASDYTASIMVPAMEQSVVAAQQIVLSMHNSAMFSDTIKLNLNEASITADNNIAPAFALASDKAAQLAGDLKNSSTYAEDASNWLEEGQSYSQGISLYGSNFAASAMLAAQAIRGAKVDAQITSDLFKGLSDRMTSAAKSTSEMLDKMRESFYFGRETAQQTYKRLRDGGMSIQNATKAAADYTARQNKADIDLRTLETKERIASNQRDRAYDRAAYMQRLGHEGAASRARQAADAKYTKKMESLRPELEKATKEAKRLMNEGGESIKYAGGSVGRGGSDGGQKVQEGGEAAGKSIKTAADALKGAVNNIDKQLALEDTLKLCKNFLKSIDQKLPQHALV